MVLNIFISVDNGARSIDVTTSDARLLESGECRVGYQQRKEAKVVPPRHSSTNSVATNNGQLRICLTTERGQARCDRSHTTSLTLKLYMLTRISCDIATSQHNWADAFIAHFGTVYQSV